jgi:organic radical activating enzyme
LKAKIDKVEFYITNVCNYNCENCNRFNNYFFAGHQLWDHFKDVYLQWSEKLDINNITVLGGEPFLNPSLPEWLQGLRQLWPLSKITVLTNGTRMKYFDNIYEVLQQEKLVLSIHLHNRDRYQNVVNYLQTEFLHAPLTYDYKNKNHKGWEEAYSSIKDVNWPECKSVDDFYKLEDWIKAECRDIHGIDPFTFAKSSGGVKILDSNQVEVHVEYSEDFVTAPIKYKGDNKFEVYNSDPIKAHDVCMSALCHHFVKGKLYKCHQVALLPEFIKQFDVDISQQDINLLKSYQALTVDKPISEMQSFINNLPEAIPQCKLCPENLVSQRIKSSTKKIKIHKKIEHLHKQ